jgi:hypothetical protein
MNAKSFDAKYFREKAALCRRLADGLSLNNPGRFQLMDMAEDLQELAKELEVQVRSKRSSPLPSAREPDLEPWP